MINFQLTKLSRPSIIKLISSLFVVESLITPDLWLRNCRSRSPTPDHSRTPTPTVEKATTMTKINVTQSQPSSSATITSSSVNLSCSSAAIERSKKPLINVLPSSKLLSRSMFHHKSSLRKRRASARLALNNKAHHSSNGNSSTSERIMNNNFPSELRAKIHSQMNNGLKQIQPNSFNRPPLQFMQRPPINLFKFRPPFHNFPSQRMPPPPAPPDEASHQMGFNALVPPTVILVPHPVLLPIIIPVPLPLSAFWNAYQTKKSPAPSSENDNHRESHQRADPAPAKAEEQPLDYTTSKSSETNDNTSPLHGDNENGTDSISSDRIENSSNGTNAEQIPKFKITRLNIKQALDVKDSNDESSRPLRKRRIIAEVDNFSESS